MFHNVSTWTRCSIWTTLQFLFASDEATVCVNELRRLSLGNRGFEAVNRDRTRHFLPPSSCTTTPEVRKLQ
ncbi:hypothetical protein NY08_2268 [Rhodococcus sp. B7740]|nr:hypothetical protein NY08_2268 [Rhodococcus sp. B7740]